MPWRQIRTKRHSDGFGTDPDPGHTPFGARRRTADLLDSKRGKYPIPVSRRLALALTTLACPAAAQTRPIRIVVPFAAGGAADSVTRSITPRLTEHLGQAIVVDNRTGADGSVGGAEVARSAPDGTTLLVRASSHIVNPSLLRGLPFYYTTAFTPISLVCTFPQMLAVKADLPARNLAEFIALARRQPLNIGTQGNATAGHLGLAQLNRAAGIETTHVP